MISLPRTDALRWTLAALPMAIALVVACGKPPSGTQDLDAGAVLPVDGGCNCPQDSGTTETPDAGSAEVDAGNPVTPDAGTDAGMVVVDAGTAPLPCGEFPAITNLGANGPFEAVATTEGPSCLIVRPKNMGMGGVKHPVIVWGNGTGALTSLYQAGFEYWASHGFIVAASTVTNGQGAGKALIDCLDYVLAQSAISGNVFEDKVCDRAGATGHSQGGGGSLMAGRDPRINATAPLQPYIQQGYGGFDQACIPQQTGPMLLLSGSNDDNAVPSVHQQPVFDKTNVPVFWASLVGGDHYSLVFGLPTYKTPMLQWFRLQLLGDESFRSVFYGQSCTLCQDTKWIVQRKNIQ